MTVMETLNSAFTSDPNAIHSLVVNRVPCNIALANHPTIQVGGSPVLPPGCFQVGMLGVLNGVLGSLGHPLVMVKFSEPDANGQRRILGFCEYSEPYVVKDE